MTLREIHTASLMFESGFRNGGASSLEGAARMDVCLPILAWRGKTLKVRLRRAFKNSYPRFRRNLCDSLSLNGSLTGSRSLSTAL